MHVKIARETNIKLFWKRLGSVHMPYSVGRQFCCERMRKGHSGEIRLCFVRPRLGIPVMHRDQPCIEGMPSGPEMSLVEDFRGSAP